MKVAAYAAPSARAPLGPLAIERRSPRGDDVEIEILFCGVCHSDLHQVRDEWGGATFPMVPGHEIVGRVTRTGPNARKYRAGDLVGVGCVVDSCGACASCRQGMEQFCEKGCAFTYNSTEMDRVTPTQGGYSTHVVVREHYVLRVPENLSPSAAAPLLCAGITSWSPLRQWGVKAGDRVAVVGLGGLGHMGVKLAASLGAEVTMISTSPAKEADARRLGATGFVLSREKDALAKHARRFDYVLDTISAPHDIDAHLALLRPGGAMTLVGVPPQALSVQPFSLIGGNRRLAGSMIGGMAETQEMLDHCGRHGIVSDVEVIPVQSIDAAYERMLRNDVRYRFVVDAASLKT